MGCAKTHRVGLFSPVLEHVWAVSMDFSLRLGEFQDLPPVTALNAWSPGAEIYLREWGALSPNVRVAQAA